MQRIVFVLAVSLFFVSCSSRIIPVQNTYVSAPLTFKSEKNFDQVWDNLVDVLIQNGYSIKQVDKNSGLISVEAVRNSVTWEDKNGKLVHPAAYIVGPKKKSGALQTYVGVTRKYRKKLQLKEPDIILGEWNFRVKKETTGTSISIYLAKPSYYKLKKQTSHPRPTFEFRSTGNFEKTIADLIT